VLFATSSSSPSLSSASSSTLTNSAVLFIKPHAVTTATVDLVKSHLTSTGVHVVQEMVISAEDIEEKGLIDAHYGTLAELAMDTHPRDLESQPGLLSPAALESFELTFGVGWDAAPLCTNREASNKFGGEAISGMELEVRFMRRMYQI
jgi:hypothetical protein